MAPGHTFASIHRARHLERAPPWAYRRPVTAGHLRRDTDAGERGRNEHEQQSAAPPTAADVVLALQSGAGNHAVSQLLARQPKTRPRRPPPKRRDPATMTEPEIHAELERIYTEMGRIEIGGDRWDDVTARGDQLHEELERRDMEERQKEREAEALAVVKTHVAKNARTSKRLAEELRYAIDTLESIEGRLSRYLGDYGAAYDKFVGVLGQAKRDVQARADRYKVLGGIIIGTTLGVTASAVLGAARGVYRIVVEAGTEVAEAIGGQVLTPDKPDDSLFTAPASLDPKLRAEPAGERLLDAWRGLARFNLTTHGFGQFQLAVQRLEFDLERSPSEPLAKAAFKIDALDIPGQLRAELDKMHSSVDDFWNTILHPLLLRSPLEIEQDLWIRWIAALPDDAETRVEALDEDVIEDHLESIGVIGEDVSRLDVDFGWSTGMGDADRAYKAAGQEEERLNQLGRYGSMSDDIKPGGRGSVWVRDEMSEKVGRKAKHPLPAKYYDAVLGSSTPVDGFQVVRIVGTRAGALEVVPEYDENGDPMFV